MAKFGFTRTTILLLFGAMACLTAAAPTRDGRALRERRQLPGGDDDAGDDGSYLCGLCVYVLPLASYLKC